jgi:phage/plasmid-associated DNA primase
LNEVESKDTFDYEGKIKSFISEDTITFNPKFVRSTTIRNISRLIITTNKPNPIKIDVKSCDRRFVVYQGSDRYLNPEYGTMFWRSLKERFNKP